MADTIQIVQWALRQSCGLRKDAAAEQDVCAAAAATGAAQLYGQYLRDGTRDGFGIFEDVMVTSHTGVYPPGTRPDNNDSRGWLARLLGRSGPSPVPLTEASLPYPYSGFVIAEKFAPVGGADGLLAMCHSCPANTATPSPAGCTGYLYPPPSSARMQQRLARILDRLGLREAYAQRFLRTDPIWFGLWTRSPLARDEVDLLGRLMTEVLREDESSPPPADESEMRPSSHLSDLRAFVRATQLALEHGLSLHVRMAPPGHTDFGFYTIFPHCPTCKAEAADVEPWQAKYPDVARPCHVCGKPFIPVATASSQRMKEEDFDSRSDLRTVLGPERFAAFARKYLLAHGANEETASRLVEMNETLAARQRADAEIARQRAKRQARFVCATLFAGLHPAYEDDRAGESEFGLFNANEFAEVLQRCRRMGIGVGFMIHRSGEQARNLHANGRHGDAERIFATWQKKGCNELFGAFYEVPENLLNDREPPPSPSGRAPG
jgi:hypothetical protein